MVRGRFTPNKCRDSCRRRRSSVPKKMRELDNITYIMNVKRKAGPTIPQTFTTGEVGRILKGGIATRLLQSWDGAGVFRPSYYFRAGARRGLLTQAERDELVLRRGVSRGDPQRRYTFHDIVWLRLIMHVSEKLGLAGVRSAKRRAAVAVSQLRAIVGDTCPSASRLVFFGRDVYLLRDEVVAECLTRKGQRAMTKLLTSSLAAEVTGRIEALIAHNEVSPSGGEASQRRDRWRTG